MERPAPPQSDFLLRTWAKDAQDDPSLASQQPYRATIEKDEAFFEGLVTQDPEVVMTLEEVVARSWAGTTPDVFDAQVRQWVQTVKQSKFGVPYTELVYKPVLELFAYLEAHD